METVITLADLMRYMDITIAVLLILVLYNALFAVVDLRKVLRRIEKLTDEVQTIIMKPINVADHILEGIVKYIETQEADKKSGKKSKPKKK